MYEFSKNIGEITNVEIDLRHELNLLNSEFSIDVLYIRNIKFVRCDCFDDLEKTIDKGNNNLIAFALGKTEKVLGINSVGISNYISSISEEKEYPAVM